jgi:hypothetical protein
MVKQKKKNTVWVYYLAWIIGIIAAGVLFYGIITSLIK